MVILVAQDTLVVLDIQEAKARAILDRPVPQQDIQVVAEQGSLVVKV